MIDTTARGVWRDLEAKLRPFIARRVRSPMDVDDVVQDVFLRMQQGVGGLRDEERFGPWVYSVTRNAIVDFQRKAAKHRVAEGVSEEDAASPQEDDEIGTDLATCMAPFVARLASPYREAITLTELEGLTQKEAADMIGISLSGMKSRVQRGRQQLRVAFEECCHVALDSRGHVISCEVREAGKVPDGCCSE